MSTGRVYLVGAGPGDPGLLTLRGCQALAEADVVVYDYLVAKRLLNHAPADAELIYVGKKAAAHTLPQEGINDLLVERARRGETVVRLKGGDPYVFGRGGEEALALVEAGLPFEVVPGVTAGIAGPAYAGIPVTHRDFGSNIGLVTGHEKPGKGESSLDWSALARWRGTLTFYMGVGNLQSICSRLVENGLDPTTPAALIRWATTPRQEVLTATVGDISERADAEGFKPPAIIVIGKVVALREKLSWFERRPLFGKRIVVTRARAQASALTDSLLRAGADVIEMPTIRIEPPEDPKPLADAAAGAASFDWIVFTSANAVDAFFVALGEAGADARALASCKVCAIGSATLKRLAEVGILPDAVPPTYTSADVVETLCRVAELDGARILCPRADIAPRQMPEALTERGACVSDVVAYRTAADTTDAADVARMLKDDEIDWITFTSSSTVRNFLGAIEVEALRGSEARIASIGPATTATIKQLGFSPDVEAAEHTIDGLVRALVDDNNPSEEESR